MRTASRLVIVALLGLFLALPVAPVALALPDGSADADVVVVQPTPTVPSTTQGGGPGRIDTETEADKAESQRKLIMGVASVVLLGLVIWGRSVRRKRKKAAEGG